MCLPSCTHDSVLRAEEKQRHPARIASHCTGRSRRHTAILASGTQPHLSSFHRSGRAPSPFIKCTSTASRSFSSASMRSSPEQPKVPLLSPSKPIEVNITDAFQSASASTSRKKRFHNLDALRVPWRSSCSTPVRPCPSSLGNSGMANSSIRARTNAADHQAQSLQRRGYPQTSASVSVPHHTHCGNQPCGVARLLQAQLTKNRIKNECKTRR